MKRVVIYALVLVGGLWVMRAGVEGALGWYNKKTLVKTARERVDLVLSMLQRSGTDATTDFQIAVSMFYRGAVLMDKDEIGHAELEFIEWLRKLGLYRKIESYEITGAEYVETDSVPGVIVNCSIEGRPIRILVHGGVPLLVVNPNDHSSPTAL